VSSRKSLSAALPANPVDAIPQRVEYDGTVLLDRRLINLAGFLICASLIAYALYSQHVLGYEPCPLCIFQRVGVVALGVVFLVAALHHPRGWGRYVYAGLTAIAGLALIGVAARHVYIQSLPPGTVPACGAPLEVMLEFSQRRMRQRRLDVPRPRDASVGSDLGCGPDRRRRHRQPPPLSRTEYA
jgi:disulfide bond formation protein DsbB